MFSPERKDMGRRRYTIISKKIYYLAAEDSISYFIFVYMFGGNRLVCFSEK